MKAFFFSHNLIKNESFIKIFKSLILIFFINLNIFKNSRNKNIVHNNEINIINTFSNSFSQNNYFLFDNYGNKKFFFNISFLNYIYSFKYNILKIEFYIGFYDNNNSTIFPSALTLYCNMQIFCHVIKLHNSNNIESLASIYNDTYYKCIEYFNINDTFKLGVIVYNKILNKYNYIFLFDNKIINYNNLNIYNLEFDPLIFNFLILKYHKIDYLNYLN